MSALTVVIASHNAADTLPAQLDALVRQPWPDGGEVIVADNRSTDDTIHVIESFAGSPVPVRRMAVDDRTGAGHARNSAVAIAANANVAFCDADDVVGDGWVAAMANGLESNGLVVGPLEFDQLNPPWLAGLRGRPLETGEIPKFEGTFPIASSCNMGVNRELFELMGGFDPDYPRAQDAELSLRLWRRGVQPRFEPDALVHYRLRTSARSIFEQSRSWGRARTPLRRALGAPAAPATAAVKSWLWLALASPRLLTRGGRARWLHVAGSLWGDMEGAWIDRRRPVAESPAVGPVRREHP